MLRATPNILIFRPADAVETIESWEIALNHTTTPSVLALSRQNLSPVRTKYSAKNLVGQGAYVLKNSIGKCKVILLASGSEVSIALQAKVSLEEAHIGTRVVSIPCWELFEQQDTKYKKKVLPRGPIRIAIEAGVRHGWDKWLFGERGSEKKSFFIGMEGFGASAPANELYENYNITVKHIVSKAKEMLNG